MPIGIGVEVDASELNRALVMVKDSMSEQSVMNTVEGIMRRTGRKVERILKDDLPRDYVISRAEVGAAVGKAKVTRGGLGVGCCIPIEGPRRSIGGGGFPASGGAHGWNSTKRRYRIKARIVKSGQSTLPQKMSSYGGQPPFRNLDSWLGKLTLTRMSKDRLPIGKVVGIAIPQMPLNRSKGAVQKDIKDYLEKEIEQHFSAMIGK